MGKVATLTGTAIQDDETFDSYHFGNLVNCKDWKKKQKLLDIASKYMHP